MRAAGAAAGEAEEERRGTLVALRRVSARLFFGDLEAGGGEPGAPACSLVFKRERWCGRKRRGVACARLGADAARARAQRSAGRAAA